MKNSSKFFCNKECEYFPCHPTDDPDNFNCLFCYCPLYVLGDKCGGNCQFLEDGTKDCSKCMMGHSPDAFDRIMSKWAEISELAKKK